MTDSETRQRYGSWQVRILEPNGTIRGCGVLVSDGYILTCAHVLSDTLQYPAEAFIVNFPRSEDRVALPAQVIPDGWFPDDSGSRRDIAILKVDGQPGLDVRPAPLGVSEGTRGNAGVVFGHPDSLPDGVWTRTQIGESVGERIQLTGNVTGPPERIERGFSGSGIIDESTGLVVGVVVSTLLDGDRFASFMIPTEVVARYWHPLADILKDSSDNRSAAGTASEGPTQPLFGQRQPAAVPAVLLQGVPHGEPLIGHRDIVRFGLWGTVDGQPLLITGGDDGTVRLWNPDSGRPIGQPLTGHVGPVRWGVWGSADHLSVLATGGDDGTLRLWDLATGNSMGSPSSSPPGVVQRSAWGNADDQLVVTMGREGGSVVRLQNFENRSLGPPLAGDGGAVVWGTWGYVDEIPVLVTGDTQETLTLWNPKVIQREGLPFGSAASKRWQIDVPATVQWGVWGQIDDNPVIATGGDDGIVRLWSAATGQSVAPPLRGHTGAVRWGAWGRVDGRVMLATGGDDKSVRIWDPVATEFGMLLTGHTGSVRWGSWATIGGRPVLATGSADGTVRLWNPSTGSPFGRSMTGHNSPVLWGEWGNLDGRPALATGGVDNTVRVWEVVEEQPVNASLPPYRSDAPTTTDQLERTAEANAVAELITARSARPPLAVGLFGDWGEGKSHFLSLLQQQVTAIARPENALSQGFVRQVRFNAWHYAETDLWASLVTELFAQLVSPPDGTVDVESGSEQRRQSRLAAELVSQRGLSERLAAARSRRDDLRTALKEPAGLWATLPEYQQQQLRVLAGDRPEKVYLEAAQAAAAIAGTGRTAWRLIRGVRVATVARLTGFLTLLLLLAAAAIWWLPPTRSWIAAVPAVVVAVAAAQQVARFASETRRRGSQIWQTALRYSAKQRERLNTAAGAADAEVAALQRQMQDFTAAGQLAGAVADRHASTDYRSRLDVMSRIRQDFTHMSRLLSQASDEDAAAGRPEDVDEVGDVLPRIDRIVIYIDDLDRCPPSRVIEMLEAVHLLLAIDLFVVVVAVDPRWLLSAITTHYRDVVAAQPRVADYQNAAAVVDPDDEALWQSTPTQYLEKIFQVVLTLPPLDTDGYQRMLHALVGPRSDRPAAPSEATGRDLEPSADASTASDGTASVATSIRPDRHHIFDERLPVARVVERKDPYALDPDELRLLDLLGPPHLVTTPRQVKRLANSYGLLTALRRRQRPDDLAEHNGPVNASGSHELLTVGYRPYRAGMVLLAALVAYPALGPGLFLHLHHHATAKPQSDWQDFVGTQLRPRSDTQGWYNRQGIRLDPVGAQQWQALSDALQHVWTMTTAEKLPLPASVSEWAKWIVPVGRLSFPTGRIVSTIGRNRPLNNSGGDDTLTQA